ncbi:hypothetical protein [Bradyrhizobium sp. USDA 3364]
MALNFIRRHCEPPGRRKRRRMTGSTKQSIVQQAEKWIASSLTLLAMTVSGSRFERTTHSAAPKLRFVASELRERRGGCTIGTWQC